ncbi:MAG: SDR family oxidoreductase [Mycobacteriaceae bacterium]|nr:SDR family oxidoreductase [Mycobacteriaceae bacterium]
MQENLLNGKVCLITGAARGLGKHFASVLANAGATVVATSLKSEMGKLEELAHDITQQRGKIIILDIDVRNYDQFDSKIADIIEQTERIDVLVNNAGVSYYTKFLEISERDWDAHIDTNLKGAFFLSQAVARQMVAQKLAGSIINIGSIAGSQSKRYALPFCISKAGMHHLTKIMAHELTDYGIRVNGISPGLFPTELVADYIASEAGQAFIQQIPLRRPGQYQELDGALLLLASDASSYMTGSIIEVDGGFAIDLFLREDFEGKTNAFFTPKKI